MGSFEVKAASAYRILARKVVGVCAFAIRRGLLNERSHFRV